MPIKRTVKQVMAPTYQLGQNLSSYGLALLPSKPLLWREVVTKRPEN
jgi:hypothetical protein